MRRRPLETRRTILDAAFWEIYRNGFQGASIDRILDGTPITKGALFHHFPNKLQLGYAVVDEVLAVWIRERWVDPLEHTADPATAIPAQVRAFLSSSPAEILHGGCPLNNLTQEMAGIDEGFRARLEAITAEWRTAVATAWRRGQEGGLGTALDAEAAAVFIVASIQGLLGAAKATRSTAHAEQAAAAFDLALSRLKS